MIRRRYLDFRYLPRPEREEVRLGMTVSRKVGRAVRRNRLRRRIREFARLELRDLPPLDLVVHCRPGAAELSGRELRRELEALAKGLRRRLA